MGSPAAFWPEALPWAQRAHNATGVLTSVILSQWAIETEYGGTDWSPNCNPGNVGSFDGKPVARFPNLTEGVAAYVQLMNAPDRPEFGATIRKATTFQQQAYLLGAANPVWASARYALPGGAPGSEIVSIIGTYGLTKYDGAGPVPTPPTPKPPPVTLTKEPLMWCTDPTNGEVWATDANGDFFAPPIAPGGTGDQFIQGLNQHPAYDAGSAESGGTNPCVGITPWKDATGAWGVCFITQPTNGQGSFGTPYHYYCFSRSGTAA